MSTTFPNARFVSILNTQRPLHVLNNNNNNLNGIAQYQFNFSIALV